MFFAKCAFTVCGPVKPVDLQTANKVFQEHLLLTILKDFKINRKYWFQNLIYFNFIIINLFNLFMMMFKASSYLDINKIFNIC